MKKKGLPALVQLAILTLITTFVWVSFEVFRALDRKPEPSVLPEVARVLDPTLDGITLDRLFNRVYLDDSEIGDTILRDTGAISEPVVEEVEVEEATQSAQI